MKNFVQPGTVVTAIAAPASGIKSGDGVLVGALFGIAAIDAPAAGGEIEIAVVGVFDLPAAGPIVVGAPVAWDAAAKRVTATLTANALIGVALLAIGAGAGTARIRLNGTAALIGA